MFVSFIGFVLVLSVSVSRATGIKNEALKDKLARSLTHVREMLVDMEHKVEQERKTLAQIDRNLTQKEEVGGGVVDNNDSDNVTTAAQGNGNDAITIKITPSLFPRPTTFETPPSNNATSLFIADIEQNMALNRHGYFTAFTEKSMELIYTKNEIETYPVVHHVAVLMHKNVEGGKFKSLGVDIVGGLKGKLTWFESLSPQRIKDQAGVLHFTLKIMEKSLSADITSLLRFYDKMFTKEEGQELFESLESFYKYPKVEGNNTFESIGERIYDAMLAPYFKSEGTRKQKRLIQLILMAVQTVDPHFRAQKMPLLKNSDTDANDSMKDTQSAFPERRSINYKKIVKHFLVKHPKLFRKIKRQYKHDKNNEHQRFSHTRKRHNNYRKSRGHQRRDRLYDREQTSQRAYTGSSYEPENEEVEADSSESVAYYRENSKAYQQKQHNAKQKQWNILKGARASTETYLPQYLKQLAIRLLRNKQQRRNFYRNRRFNIASSQEDFCNHSQNVQDSIENHMLHKITEASSYSDEEDNLRNNLYDALRHGNRTFVSLRKSDGGINNKQTLMALSSETDDEWILKNNIYKVFEQEKK